MSPLLAKNTYRKRLGQQGEQWAADYLAQQGLSIIARNWRHGKSGEIDIVAYNPHHQTLHLVEVKTRSSSTYGQAIEAITPKKQQQLTQLAEAYFLHHQDQYPQYPVQQLSQDAVIVRVDKATSTTLEWLQNAWSP